jgi:hypothetical protein
MIVLGAVSDAKGRDVLDYVLSLHMACCGRRIKWASLLVCCGIT